MSTKTAVLIDNDKLAQITWSYSAEKAGVDLHCFYSVEEFLQKKEQFETDTPIYIDYYLNGNKGDEVAKTLGETHGFSQLVIQTGEDFKNITRYSCISSVQDKTPPW